MLKIKKLSADAKLPTRAHPDDAGIDLYCLNNIVLNPSEPIRVPTGIAVAIPHGHVGMICDRSSLGAKGIRVLGGIVDAGYRGEVQVILINLRQDPTSFSKGDKIAQMLIMPASLCGIEEVEELGASLRANGGFGSTGK